MKTAEAVAARFIRRQLRASGRKLCVFDCDDTIISSEMHVKVHKKNGEDITLDSATFAQFKPIHGDQLDFADVNHITRPRIIKRNFETLKQNTQEPGTSVVILTARPKGSVSAIRKFLAEHGISHVQIVALASSDPHDKGRWVRAQIIENHYDSVEFTDDSRANVEAMKKWVTEAAAGIHYEGHKATPPTEEDYDGPAHDVVYHSDNPTEAKVDYEEPDKPVPASRWWDAQSDDFQQNYCRDHTHSHHCQGGAPQ